MKTKTPVSRQKLLTLLQHHGIAPAAFDALRADAYEKRLAAHSLTDLDHLYTTLLNPALSYLQMQPLCPPWPSGRQTGRPPSLQTLCDIKHRLMAEQTVNDLSRMEKLLTTLRHRSTVQSVALQTELFNAIIALLGEELLAAKLDGKPITENLRGVDRLIKVAALRLRQQQGEARQKLQERREDRLDRRQSGNQCDTNQEDQDEYVEDDSGLTEDEKSRNLIEKIYGPMPRPTEPEPASAPSPPAPTPTPPEGRVPRVPNSIHTPPLPVPTPPPSPTAQAVVSPPTPVPKRLTPKERNEKSRMEALAKLEQLRKYMRTPAHPYPYKLYPDNYDYEPQKNPGNTN